MKRIKQIAGVTVMERSTPKRRYKKTDWYAYNDNTSSTMYVTKKDQFGNVIEEYTEVDRCRQK